MTVRGGVVGLVLRADLRRHPVATCTLALLVGLVGAATIVAFAGSRRAASSFDRLVEATSAENIDIEFDEPQDPSVLSEIAKLPGVEHASLSAFVAAVPAEADFVPFVDAISFAQLAQVGTDEPMGIIVEGRPLGSDPDEILLNQPMADRLGVGVGDRVPLISLTEETALRALGREEITTDGPRTTATVVGIMTDPEDIADVPEPYTIVPAAYAETYGVGSFPILAGVLVDEAQLTPTVERLRTMFPDAVVTPSADLGARIEDGLRVQSFGLLAFALAVGLTGAIAVAQQVARSTSAWSTEHRVLGALGATVADRRVAALVRATPIALAGALVAIAVGVVAGPLAITGLARQAEPDPGPWFDAPVVAVVAFLLVGIVLGAAWASVRSPARAVSRRPLLERGLLSRLPVMTFLGARRSLGTEARRWSGPEAVGTLGAALLVVVALLTFTYSVDHLFASPQQWGANFDAYVLPASSEAEFEAAAAELKTDNEIESASVVADAEITMARPDGSEVNVRVNWAEPLKGAAEPWVLVDGEPLRTDGDVLVGASVMQDLDVDVGDHLDLPTPDGTLPVRVAGRIVAYGNDRIDDAIVMTAADAARVLGDVDENLDSKVIVVAFAEGVDDSTGIAELRDRYGDAGRAPAPGTIDNLDELGLLPLVLGVVVALLGLYAAALSLALSVARDKGFFATLRAIGSTRAQRARVVLAQAGFLVLASLVVAIPGGILVGRAVYRAVANGLGAIARPAVPSLALVAVTVAAAACVLAIASLPARRAARVEPEALRSE